MSRHGHVLKPSPDGIMVCLESGFRYKEVSQGVLKCQDLNEEKPLLKIWARGKEDYRQIRAKENK